ncbi:MAG TPA: HD domain-containing protein, partial [Anaerolineae bacterium]|nr:HD domain-containing protein [Anaerolineae bacterium]
MPPDNAKWSVLDLIDLPPSQRGILLHLSRHGPADAEMLAEVLGRDLAEVQEALATLLQQGRIRQASGSRWDISLGHVSRHTTLPARVWPALLATDRIYSEQEIATLRTAVPLLQFARAKLSEFTDHGPSHGLRVKSFATQLSYILDLTPAERHLLRAGALFHDIGNVVDRGRHNVISQETVERLAAAGKLPFTAIEAELVGLLCRWHRSEYDPNRTHTLRREPIRTGQLASILRVADAMDIDHRRSDYRDKFRQVIEFFFPDSLPHWTGLEQILGVRIHCNPAVSLQVFAQGRVADNLQIDMLRGDLASTLLDWSVTEIDIESPAGPESHP